MTGPSEPADPPMLPATLAQASTITQALIRAQRVTNLIRARIRRSPGNYIRWMPLQHRFLNDPHRIKLVRTGNQHSGKTTALLYEVICRCSGNHPFLKVKKPPIHAWVVCASREQSVPIQQKFVDLLPEDCLINLDEFHPTKGFPLHNTVARFKNGSTVRFKTTNQGAISFAGATIDLVAFDEPPTSQGHFNEARSRVMRRAGYLLVAMTPINAGPMDWLKDLVDRGVISETWAPLSPEMMIPVGEASPIRLADGTPCDDAWIAKLRDEAIPSEAAVRIDGEWEARAGDRYFPAFRRWTHHITKDGLGDGNWKLMVGIDHGEDIAKQCAVAVAVQINVVNGKKRYKIHVLDEYATDKYSSTEDDAQGILDMLSRQGLNWGDVDEAWGDREVRSGAQRIGGKGNRDLFDEMSRIMRNEPWYSATARICSIRTVKRGQGRLQGSVREGCEFLHQRMIKEGEFYIAANCTRLIEALDRWDGTSGSIYKDPIDALRYALNSLVFDKPARAVQSIRRA